MTVKDPVTSRPILQDGEGGGSGGEGGRGAICLLLTKYLQNMQLKVNGVNKNGNLSMNNIRIQHHSFAHAVK